MSDTSTANSPAYCYLYFRFYYCVKCDRFDYWESSPMTEARKLELQNFMRSRWRIEGSFQK